MKRTFYFPFESRIEELDMQISSLSSERNKEEIKSLKNKREKHIKELYKNLSPLQRVHLARHPDRPKTLDYFAKLWDEFVPLHGDRNFSDDEALVGGLAKFENQSLMIIGIEKGKDQATRAKHNFGMCKPEGYRKAVRLMELADRFDIPVVTFVDTQGAYAGVEAEQRGQGEAIARSIYACLELKVPIISYILGEGGSGGAIALASANKLFMLENSIFSVISPEGCASILWKSTSHAGDAASALKLTAQDAKKFGIADEVLQEPIGGAHENPDMIINSLRTHLIQTLKGYKNQTHENIIKEKEEKFLKIGKDI